MKKIISLTMASLLTGVIAAVGLTNFPDVREDHPRRTDILYAVAQNWFQGYEDGTFRPDQQVPSHQLARVVERAFPDGATRGELATFMRAGVEALGHHAGQTREDAISYQGIGWVDNWSIEVERMIYQASTSKVQVDLRMGNWGEKARQPSSSITVHVYGDRTGIFHDREGSHICPNREQVKNTLSTRLEAGRILTYSVCFEVGESDPPPTYLRISQYRDDQLVWIRLKP